MSRTYLAPCAFLAAALGLVACGGESDPFAHVQEQVTIDRGAFGVVVYRQGDWMPHPDGGEGGSQRTVSREVRVHEATTASDTTPSDALQEFGVGIVSTPIVASTHSADDGFFQISLAPGHYSLFVEAEGDWFCKDERDGVLCPFDVGSDGTVEQDVMMDYAAAY